MCKGLVTFISLYLLVIDCRRVISCPNKTFPQSAWSRCLNLSLIISTFSRRHFYKFILHGFNQSNLFRYKKKNFRAWLVDLSIINSTYHICYNLCSVQIKINKIVFLVVFVTRSVTRSYYRGAAGALLVYDIARSRFDHLFLILGVL